MVSSHLERHVPGFYFWLNPRLGEGRLAYLVVFALIVDFALTLNSKDTQDQDHVSRLSSTVIVNACSLLVALTVSFCVLGRGAFHALASPSTSLRFFGIGCLFFAANICDNLAIRKDASWTEVYTLGTLYMPAAALISMFVLKRDYGCLEWLSLGILSLTVAAFVQLRDMQSKDLHRATASNACLVLVGAFASAVASVFAERIYKDRSRSARRFFERSNSLGALVNNVDGGGSDRATAAGNVERQLNTFYLYKVHLDGWALLISLVAWKLEVMSTPGSEASLFDKWDANAVFRIALRVLESWLAGLVVKYFSTLFRAINTTFVTLVVVSIFGVYHGDTMFSDLVIPSTLMAIIMVCSVLIFQTGRLNIKALGASLRLRQADTPDEAAQSPFHCCWCCRRRGRGSADDGGTGGAGESSGTWFSLRKALSTYSSMVVFILADASRTLSQQQALSKTMITPLSMALACFLAGIGAATVMTVAFARPGTKIAALRQAYDLRKVWRVLPSSAFFALSSTSLCVAYAYRTSASLSQALGYVYVPISAFASRFVLNKYYMWLEWLGLIILTAACGAFGFLQTSSGDSDGSASWLGMLLVVLSSATSAVASLLAQKVLKEDYSVPFHIQKVWLDVGSLISTCALLPVIGYLSARPQDAFWKDRPLSYDCRSCICQDGPRANCTDACPLVNPGSCTCGSGIFVAWGSELVLAALAVNVCQGWLNGVVIKQFDTVLRSVAQAFTLLLIYFIADPLLNPESHHNIPMTLCALVVPLSTTVFSVAASEMRKVVDIARSDSIGAAERA
eukprot:TRINITY_DN18879_c0_g1_i1.p1 TRINITY_DN18879_c0_g1~~TRINITY_DN18879_c0_g1_i1.p1  ORF type:complete len:919 (+),score=157.48 TRINITY_DN18879_c0_g1_i1:374-2758(+)